MRLLSCPSSGLCSGEIIYVMYAPSAALIPFRFTGCFDLLRSGKFFSQRQESSMIQRFDRAFAAIHNIADLLVREPIHEFQDQQLLPIFWQTTDRCQKTILLFLRFSAAFWRFGS